MTKQPTSEPAFAPASFQKVAKPSFERPQSRSHMSVISSGYLLGVAQTKTKREHHLFCGFQVDSACGVCVCVSKRSLQLDVSFAANCTSPNTRPHRKCHLIEQRGPNRTPKTNASVEHPGLTWFGLHSYCCFKPTFGRLEAR